VAVGNLSDYACPMGHFCPEGTERANQYPCPPGTYNNDSLMASEAEACEDCPPGYYCQDHGLPQPQGLCLPG
jgi:hypothetical protein